jgi:uncharacterized membrane protein YccF (DUF307 family)
MKSGSIEYQTRMPQTSTHAVRHRFTLQNLPVHQVIGRTVIGQFAFLPFGREAVSRAEVRGANDIGSGSLGAIGNIIWFVFAGIWLAMGHFVSALCCFVTIVGIPFGFQHLKLAAIAIAPIGKTIVSKESIASGRH